MREIFIRGFASMNRVITLSFSQRRNGLSAHGKFLSNSDFRKKRISNFLAKDGLISSMIILKSVLWDFSPRKGNSLQTVWFMADHFFLISGL